MKILDLLKEINNYYNENRQVGHTTVMAYGAIQEDCHVVVHNHDMSEHMERNFGIKKKDCVTISQIEYGGLRGSSKPIVIDNAALSMLLTGAIHEIERLEKVEKKFDAIKSITNGIQYEIH